MIDIIIQTVNFIHDGVYMLWEMAAALPIVSGTIICIVALAVLLLITGR